MDDHGRDTSNNSERTGQDLGVLIHSSHHQGYTPQTVKGHHCFHDHQYSRNPCLRFRDMLSVHSIQQSMEADRPGTLHLTCHSGGWKQRSRRYKTKIPTYFSTLTYSLGFICITDLFCSLIPIVIFRDLRIQKRTKIGLCFVMGLGVLSVSFLTLQNVSIDRQPVSPLSQSDKL